MTELSLDDEFEYATPTTNWDEMLELDLFSQPVLAPVYRMPERDVMNSPNVILTKGSLIEFSRIVVRVGYEIGVHSVTRKEWFEVGANIIAARSGEPIEIVKRIVANLGIWSPFKEIKSAIYDELIRPLIQQTKPENRNMRAMWFYDYGEPRTGEIVGTVVKLTGKRDAGGQSGYYGDWAPPFLSATGRQVLYEVYDNHPDIFSRTVLVYPADVTERR